MLHFLRDIVDEILYICGMTAPLEVLAGYWDGWANAFTEFVVLSLVNNLLIQPIKRGGGGHQFARIYVNWLTVILRNK